MLRWFFRRKLDSEEKRLGESMDYLRHVVEVSPMAFLRFASIMPFANSRSQLPADAWYVAQLTALKYEDCGPCLQITVNLAQQNGVDPLVIRAVIDDDCSCLKDDLRVVFDFTQSVMNHADDDELRENLRSRYGERGLIEMSYAIAAGRIPPTVKRVLGYAKSCKAVSINIDEPEATKPN